MRMKTKRDIGIFVLDNLVTCLVIGPLVVMYWRGTWVLFGHYVYSDNLKLSGWIGMAIGNVGLIAATLLQWVLKERVDPKKPVVWVIGYHLYIYVFGFASVCHWFGAWTLIDEYIGKGSPQNGAVVAVTGVLLICLRCFKTLVAPPMVVAVDTDAIFFVHTTRYRTTPSNWEHHIWDAILTVAFIGNLVSGFWHSMRVLLDNAIYPDNDTTSAWVCFGFSYAGLMISCLPQYYGNLLFRKLKKRMRTRLVAVILEDLVFALGVFAAVAHWKAFWMIWELYILPDNTVGSGWLCHFLGLGLLMLMLSGETTVLRGCFLDGDDDLEAGCIFPNHYIRYFIRRYRHRQTANRTMPKSAVAAMAPVTPASANSVSDVFSTQSSSPAKSKAAASRKIKVREFKSVRNNSRKTRGAANKAFSDLIDIDTFRRFRNFEG